MDNSIKIELNPSHNEEVFEESFFLENEDDEEEGHENHSDESFWEKQETNEENDGDEEADESDDSYEDVLSEEEAKESPFMYKSSEQDFQESDLANRKKRRYLLKRHSFLELNDPHLEDALETTIKVSPEDATIEEQTKKRGLRAERAKYKELCKAGDFSPNPAFLNSLGKSILDITNNGLKENEIEAMCLALADDKHIEILRLTGNCCGKAGGLAIAQMLKDNTAIEELCLANAEIIEPLEEICEAISLNTTLVLLDLSKNELIDADMSPVANMLAENQSIKILRLAANEIKDPGLAELGWTGLRENSSLLILDLSGNKIKGEQRANSFFKAAAAHPSLRELYFHHNRIRNSGAAGFGRILRGNDRIEMIDLAFNIMEEPAGPTLGGGINTGRPRDLERLNLEKQWWHSGSAGGVLGPLANKKNLMPIQLIDFGWMLDIHKTFITARDQALTVHPDLKIIHGQPYGLNKAKRPDEKPLVIKRANIVCENFETPLVMLMEELAKEPNVLTRTAFRKFIKQCNLYKDKSLTDAFENVFATPNGNDVDGTAILEAFDKEYPGLRKIPDPVPEEEPKEPFPKNEKKVKGKKAGKREKGGRKSPTGKPKGKGKSKPKKK